MQLRLNVKYSLSSALDPPPAETNRLVAERRAYGEIIINYEQGERFPKNHKDAICALEMKGSMRDQSKVLVPERIEHFNLLFCKDGKIQKTGLCIC